MCGATRDVRFGPKADIVGNRRQRSLGIMKDNSKRMTHSAPNATHTVPKVDAVSAPRSFDWAVVDGECDRGRQQAHDIIYEACRTVNEKGGTLVEVLSQNPTLAKQFDWAALSRLTDPAKYLGLAPDMVDRVLRRSNL